MEPDIDAPIGETEWATVKKTRFVLVGILLVVTAVTAYFYFQVRTLEQNPDRINQERVAMLVNKVGKLIDLPQGEIPSAATISDPTPLANNPFFARAKAGHEVLFYTGARKAFLYDPAVNIIVEVATINLGP